ncbi:MAG: DUF433 domain-containing protein [Chitinophagales bacterium]|nr:DUF433 domain-containing protein [Chitinophagales bacterium]
MENLLNRIEINSAVMLGKPVIKGTRITIETIMDELAAGYTHNEILKAHPNLQEADILAALQYASAMMKNEKIYTSAS